MLAKSKIAKGKVLEQWVCDKFIETGLDTKAIRVPGSGNGTHLKTDISTSITIGDRTLGIECKNHKIFHAKEFWEQTCKLEKLGYLPVLIYKLEGEQYENAKVVLYLNDFIEMLKIMKNCGFTEDDKENGVFISEKDKYKIKRCIDSLKDVLKTIEK